MDQLSEAEINQAKTDRKQKTSKKNRRLSNKNMRTGRRKSKASPTLKPSTSRLATPGEALREERGYCKSRGVTPRIWIQYQDLTA